MTLAVNKSWANRIAGFSSPKEGAASLWIWRPIWTLTVPESSENAKGWKRSGRPSPHANRPGSAARMRFRLDALAIHVKRLLASQKG